MEPKTTPRDFFLWLGAIAAFYGSVISFLTLLFEYINRTHPDPLAYFADPYASTVRLAMATLVVLAPVTVALVYLIRRTIMEDRSREHLWVRRWAIMLTLFIAGATVAVDLITLLTTFLGGEITVRFVLKVAVVLLVAVLVFLHFLAELRGYWFREPRRAHVVAGAALVLALLTVLAGFVIVGTPSEMRMSRFDQQKVQDLQTLQYEIANYYQLKRELPDSLAELADPFTTYGLPADPQGGAYRYEKTGDLSFRLCATFNRESEDLAGQGGYGHSMARPMMGGIEETWQHGAGETCFTRTIDPERYPPAPKPL